MKIALDGPSGAGKSSLARAIARELGIVYVDTGALYRTVGLFVRGRDVDPKDNAAVIACLPDITLRMSYENGEQHIYLSGEDVGDRIRTPEMSMYASAVSAIPEVRTFLLDTQRRIAQENSVVMDGRDIGTVILPDAEVKIFLTASPEARARRRTDELIAKGSTVTYEEVLADMQERDKNDSTRAVAPAIPAEDAVMLDNSDLTPEGTLARALAIIAEKTGVTPGGDGAAGDGGQNAEKAVCPEINAKNDEETKPAERPAPPVRVLTEAERRAEIKGARFYRRAHFCLAWIVRLFFRIRVKGYENIPKEGGCLICANHIGAPDMVGIAAVCRRRIRFVAKAELFRVPIIGWFIRRLGAYPVERKGSDVSALKKSIQLVADGELVSLFPQGHRYPGVNPATTPLRAGAGMIAWHSHCDVLPIAVRVKNLRYGLFSRIELVIGKPIPNSELGFTAAGGREEYRVATERIFAEICRLGGYTAEETADKATDTTAGGEA